jgi:hypothetical protein
MTTLVLAESRSILLDAHHACSADATHHTQLLNRGIHPGTSTGKGHNTAKQSRRKAQQGKKSWLVCALSTATQPRLSQHTQKNPVACMLLSVKVGYHISTARAARHSHSSRHIGVLVQSRSAAAAHTCSAHIHRTSDECCAHGNVCRLKCMLL